VSAEQGFFMRAVVRLLPDRRFSPLLLGLLSTALVLPLSGCGGGNFFGADGPSTGRIVKTGAERGYGAILIDVNDRTVSKARNAERPGSFVDVLGEGQPFGTAIGAGDTLQVTIFEAPPATLFGTGSLDSSGLAAGYQRANVLPELQVTNAGTIDVPFAGRVAAAGRTREQVARDIRTRLLGKAHDPQVVVSIGQNAASTVTIVGEVNKSTRMPLTPKGERLLDALAAGGGTREPVDKVSVQITRGGTVTGMPLDAVIRDPRQNIYLRAGDVITAFYQSQSFTVLGAAGKNEEIKFETQGITLAQALGRIGGIRDDRANPRGVFIFRLEDPSVIEGYGVQSAQLTPEAKVPVIYRINMRDPVTFFAAQHFAMRDQDVVYVTSAPAADLQKFVNIIGTAVYPIVTVKAAGF